MDGNGALAAVANGTEAHESNTEEEETADGDACDSWAMGINHSSTITSTNNY